MTSSIMMRRVHDKARVHVALGMMGVAALGMFANAIIGKPHWNEFSINQ